MNILFVCHRMPFPPNYGSQVRAFNIIKHFHQQGHQVTVSTLARTPKELRAGEGLKRHCKKLLVEKIASLSAWAKVLVFLPTMKPVSEGYFLSSRLYRRIRKALSGERYDLVFVHSSSVAHYVADVLGIPKILDFTDMDSQKWLTYSHCRRIPLSWGYWIEGIKLQRREAELSYKFDVCTCATHAELAALKKLAPDATADWFSNGVDTDYFGASDTPYDTNTISFIGRMNYYPNELAVTSFCRETLPLLRAKHPNLRLVVVGADPPRAVRRLAQIPGVIVTGSVPDVRPYVQRSVLTVAPLQIARGTQNKILESMAMGVPVVASDPAAKGVDAVPGKHLLTANTPQQYSEAILKLIGNPDERRKLSEAGRNRILSHHSWESAMKRLDQIIANCIGLRTRGLKKVRGTKPFPST